MALKEEFYFPSSDGIHRIHGCRWLPASGGPRAVVQLVHGISEHVGRYDHFAFFLAGHGIAGVGHDHLGHGRTARDRKELGYLGEKDGWRHLVDDVGLLRERTGRDFPGAPYFLMGHSMGSFVVRTYLIDRPGTIDGCILSGTGQEPAPLILLGRGLSGLLRRVRGERYVSPLVISMSLGAYDRQFRPNRTAADWISRDEQAVDAYVSDPLCRFVPTVGMFHDMMGGLRRIGDPRELRKMDPSTPVYFFSGESDPVGGRGKGVRKVADLFRQAGCRDVEVKLYPGGRHEMLNELNRGEVYDDLLDWLDHRLAQ